MVVPVAVINPNDVTIYFGEEVDLNVGIYMFYEWYSEYVFQIVVRKDFLSDTERAVLDSEPNTIEPWDPLGTLA